MIPFDYITEWRQQAPWTQDFQVEQDLIICQALVKIFNQPLLSDHLAFRGGTALYKLHIPPARYSEDIDLVQVQSGPIGPVMESLRDTLDPWLGKPNWKQSEGRITMVYRIQSEDGVPLRLKVEINSREHFSVLGLMRSPFTINSRWFSGSTSILTYHLDELLGTKMRALYQRKKGRDLFDLWLANKETGLEPAKVVKTFLHYMEHEGHKVSRAGYEENLLKKLTDPFFTTDMEPLLSYGNSWNFKEAADFIMKNLITLLPGEPWQGKI